VTAAAALLCFVLQVVLQRADGSMEWQKADSFEMILGPLMGHHVTPAVADVHFEG
jgi:hypothetical protein